MEEQIRQYFIDKYERYFDVNKIKFFDFYGESQLPNIAVNINGINYLFNVTRSEYEEWKIETRSKKINKIMNGI